MAPKETPVDWTDPERAELVRLRRKRTGAQGLAFSATIVLKADDGMSNLRISQSLETTRMAVAEWRDRFAAKRLDGLLDKARSGRPRQIGDDKVEEIVEQTLYSRPRGATRWSRRVLAEALGVDPSTVNRVWRAVGLQPSRSKMFAFANVALVVEKMRYAVGLY